MTALPFIEALPEILGAIRLDDGSLALIAMLLGMSAGWAFFNYRAQLRARKAKVETRQPPARPESD